MTWRANWPLARVERRVSPIPRGRVSVDPVASIHRSTNGSAGRTLPASTRATAGWFVPILPASACWVSPARSLRALSSIPKFSAFKARLYQP